MGLLPQQKTPPQVDLYDQTILVYGPAKAGKSTFCAEANNALFLATEAGLNHLNVYQIPIRTWDDFLAAAAEIAAGSHSFKTIVVDTIDIAYKLCSEYVCKQQGIKHESDLGYGKGYSLVNGEFYRVMNKLSMLPYGLFLISHSQERELDSRVGKYTKQMPSLSEKGRKIVIGMCDLILYFDIEETTTPEGVITQNRVIRTKPAKHFEAGDRTGRLPDDIEMDFHKFQEAYRIATQVAADENAHSNSPSNRPKDNQTENRK